MAGVTGTVVVEVREGKSSLASNFLGGVKGGLFGMGGGGAESGAAGAVGGTLGSLALVTGVLTIISTGIKSIWGVLTEASPMLKAMLGGITKLLMLILKPIGDIFGVALMPLLYILKPIGTFFNALMKPYIQKAMASMRAGGELLKSGDIKGAGEAFILGGEYLLKPFFDMFVSAFSTGLGSLSTIIGTVLGPILGAPFLEAAKVIAATGQSIIETSTDALDTQLGALLANTEAKTGTSFAGIVKNIGDAQTTIAYLGGEIANGIFTPFNDINGWIESSWAQNFKDAVKAAFEKALQNLPIPTYPGGGYGIKKDVNTCTPWWAGGGIDSLLTW
jgi:hypothetical protein